MLSVDTSMVPMRLVSTTNSYVPDKVFQRVQEFAPDYDFHIFDDVEAEHFLEHNFGEHVASAFRTFRGAHKADLFRYGYLYVHGGVYMDIKTELIKPLPRFESGTYTVLSTVPGTVYQGFIASVPGVPLMLHLLQ